MDALANVYLTGETDSTNFPTLNPFQPTYDGGADDALLAVIATCTLTFSAPPEASAGGASGSVTITTTPECGWNAASNSAWITLTSSTSGQGAGSVSYSVAANTGAPRSGTLTIAGKTVTIAQFGSGASTATHLSVAAPSSATAGVPIQFTVTALDANNNTVTGFTDPVAFTSTDSAASLPGNVTLTNGVGSFSATLATPVRRPLPRPIQSIPRLPEPARPFPSAARTRAPTGVHRRPRSVRALIASKLERASPPTAAPV